MTKSLLSINQKIFLTFFSNQKSLYDLFYLTGGTALSEFYLQHRYSEDLDFFSEKEFEIKRKICSAGCDRHFDSEKILLDQGSKQENLWGGGIDLETNSIDCNSMINIRPQQGNMSNEIQDATTRQEFDELTKYFFTVIYGK